MPNNVSTELGSEIRQALVGASLSTPELATAVQSAAEYLARVRSILQASRHQALQTVNAAMVQAYWQIGQEIVEEEQHGKARAEYGARLIDELASQLTQEFGRGFIPRNLRYMRAFYIAFPIWNAVRSKLSWTQNRMWYVSC